jgi:HK97 gp10 family phage protein
MIDIKVGGLEELDNLLKQLPPRVEKRVLQSAVTSAIRQGRKEIKRSAPSGDDVSSVQKKYGYKKLKNELKVKRLKRTKRNEKASRVDTGNAFWALFYELGTRYQPARPFFAKAFRRAEGAMIKKLSERLKIGINREVDKLR